MSGQLRTLRNRIRSVENTKKITRAMEMVAAAKLRRFQDMMVKSRAYTQGLESLLKRLGRGGPCGRLERAGTRPAPTFSHPFLVQREEKCTAFVLMTSDSGLCGSYNLDLVNLAKEFMKSKSVGAGLKPAPTLIGVGKSGITAFKSMGIPCACSFTDIRASRVEEILGELRRKVEKLYLSGEVDSIYVIYSRFKNVTSFKAATEKILPLEKPSVGALREAPLQSQQDISKEYIFEPSPEAVFEKLVPLYFEAKMRMIFLEAIVSEQLARMTAMHQATKNAKEMIDSLVLKRNKARQAAITKELIEIVSGSQALKR